ncbi:type II toxin-antitoxin system RelE/ParE family toxin [Candidatus Micrarchaeota archaeon]|nr:type II toxin-antitoxin system RelE/ParE family toxin [Candidatus Micrarchaeota archaeon]
MPYSAVYDLLFLKRLKKLKKDDPQLFLRLQKKMEEVAATPQHYKPLSNVLKGKRRAHIGSFVVIFSVDETGKAIIFLEFEHHDHAYR